MVTSARVTRVEGKSGESVKLHANRDGSEIVLEGTHLLVATGRTPNTGGIGLEFAGVETTDRGYVKVNERLETTAPDVWAVGDCAGSPHFTHISFDDFRIVSDNILGGHRVTTGRQVPFCMFTDPEFARIGLSETEAKAQGIAYRLAKDPDGHGIAHPDAFRDPRLHESPHRYQERSHPWLHRFRSRSGRNHGLRAGRDDRRAPLYRVTRRHIHPSYHVGRTHPAFYEMCRPPPLPVFNSAGSARMNLHDLAQRDLENYTCGRINNTSRATLGRRKRWTGLKPRLKRME